MGVASVAFALKLTQGNRVGLAASETSPRAGTWPATAEQQQVVRSPFLYMYMQHAQVHVVCMYDLSYTYHMYSPCLYRPERARA